MFMIVVVVVAGFVSERHIRSGRAGWLASYSLTFLSLLRCVSLT